MPDTPSPGSRLDAYIALLVAITATFMALCNVKDGNIVQGMAQAQSGAIDAWSYYQAKSTKQSLAEATLDQITKGRGPDSCIDAVGMEAHGHGSWDAVADRALASALGGRDVVRDRSTRVLAELARLVAAGELDPHVTQVRPLSEAGAALALVEGGHARGKVVLVP